MLNKLFDLDARGTTARTEIIAGLTTFLAMSYIIFVNPDILANAGMDKGAVFVATCLSAAIGSAIMGLYANYPIAIAPGMGLNAYFTYGVVIGMGLPWQVALAAVFLSGLIFVALSLLPIREWIINAIPLELKMAISAGIGLFPPSSRPFLPSTGPRRWRLASRSSSSPSCLWTCSIRRARLSLSRTGQACWTRKDTSSTFAKP
jgi:xanthine/uracil/vitamin C permease (AzgA family)